MSLTTYSHLRPLTMGQIIDRAIRLCRHNLGRFVGLAALVQIPVGLVALLPTAALWYNNALGDIETDPERYFNVMFYGGLLTMVVALVSGIWAQVGAAAMTQMAVDSYLGQTTGIAAAFTKIGRSWVSLLGALLLGGLIVLGFVILFVIPCVNIIAGIPGAGMVIYGVLILLPLLVPVVVLERLSAGKALRRTWELARQRFWWLFGFFLLLALFSLVVVQGPLYLLLGITALASGLEVGGGALSIIQVVAATLLGVIYFPIQTICVMLVYLDLRIRHEGLDLALQAADGVLDEPAIVLRQSPPASERLLVGAEWGYFIAISVGLGLVFGVIIALFTLLMFPLMLGA